MTLYDYLSKALGSDLKLGGKEASYDVYWVEKKGKESSDSRDSRFVKQLFFCELDTSSRSKKPF